MFNFFDEHLLWTMDYFKFIGMENAFNFRHDFSMITSHLVDYQYPEFN
ncbi:hypothetical protein [Planobacterium oryzisoli]|uniref:Uncharacterized protein n=1 Tax=Planobacterium oryzisoli TaxID=2771435 RepID=A0A930YUN6_9FLAO|nr:hypothetical protein [Planobacterium oryzisoli]MBF5026672.1 hypothetical protein [Planobacterium oryzisoli]